MKKNTSGIKNYLSLIKFSHTVFALPFAFIGFLLGAKEKNFEFDNKLPFLVLGCMVFARSAAMAFNRWADQWIDSKNFRTRSREIPSGIISSQAALGFTAVCCLLFVTCCYFINTLCFYLSPVALLVILGYSYTKRFTSLSHLFLGLGLSLAPIGAYLAVTGSFRMLPLLFSIAVLLWVSGFDIIYALQDIEFDRENKLHSLPARLGIEKSLMVSSVLHVLTSIVLLAASFYGSFTWIYISGWIVFSILLYYQHTLVKPGDLSRVNVAFFTTNGIASIVFAVLVAFEVLHVRF